MRKMYQEPATEVAKLQTTAGLLTGSPEGPAGAPLNVGRIGYGDAGSGETWD